MKGRRQRTGAPGASTRLTPVDVDSRPGLRASMGRSEVPVPFADGTQFAKHRADPRRLRDKLAASAREAGGWRLMLFPEGPGDAGALAVMMLLAPISGSSLRLAAVQRRFSSTAANNTLEATLGASNVASSQRVFQATLPCRLRSARPAVPA